MGCAPVGRLAVRLKNETDCGAGSTKLGLVSLIFKLHREEGSAAGLPGLVDL